MEDSTEEILTVDVTQDQVDSSLQCGICLEEFKIGESVRKLKCLHVYHPACIVPWLDKNSTCPTCRCPLLIQTREYSSDESVDAETDEDDTLWMFSENYDEEVESFSGDDSIFSDEDVNNVDSVGLENSENQPLTLENLIYSSDSEVFPDETVFSDVGNELDREDNQSNTEDETDPEQYLSDTEENNIDSSICFTDLELDDIDENQLVSLDEEHFTDEEYLLDEEDASNDVWKSQTSDDESLEDQFSSVATLSGSENHSEIEAHFSPQRQENEEHDLNESNNERLQFNDEQPTEEEVQRDGDSIPNSIDWNHHLDGDTNADSEDEEINSDSERQSSLEHNLFDKNKVNTIKQNDLKCPKNVYCLVPFVENIFPTKETCTVVEQIDNSFVNDQMDKKNSKSDSKEKNHFDHQIVYIKERSFRTSTPTDDNYYYETEECTVEEKTSSRDSCSIGREELNSEPNDFIASNGYISNEQSNCNETNSLVREESCFRKTKVCSKGEIHSDEIKHLIQDQCSLGLKSIECLHSHNKIEHKYFSSRYETTLNTDNMNVINSGNKNVVVIQDNAIDSSYLNSKKNCCNGKDGHKETTSSSGENLFGTKSLAKEGFSKENIEPSNSCFFNCRNSSNATITSNEFNKNNDQGHFIAGEQLLRDRNYDLTQEKENFPSKEVNIFNNGEIGYTHYKPNKKYELNLNHKTHFTSENSSDREGFYSTKEYLSWNTTSEINNESDSSEKCLKTSEQFLVDSESFLDNEKHDDEKNSSEKINSYRESVLDLEYYADDEMYPSEDANKALANNWTHEKRNSNRVKKHFKKRKVYGPGRNIKVDSNNDACIDKSRFIDINTRFVKHIKFETKSVFSPKKEVEATLSLSDEYSHSDMNSPLNNNDYDPKQITDDSTNVNKKISVDSNLNSRNESHVILEDSFRSKESLHNKLYSNENYCDINAKNIFPYNYPDEETSSTKDISTNTFTSKNKCLTKKECCSIKKQFVDEHFYSSADEHLNHMTAKRSKRRKFICESEGTISGNSDKAITGVFEKNNEYRGGEVNSDESMKKDNDFAVRKKAFSAKKNILVTAFLLKKYNKIDLISLLEKKANSKKNNFLVWGVTSIKTPLSLDKLIFPSLGSILKTFALTRKLMLMRIPVTLRRATTLKTNKCLARHIKNKINIVYPKNSALVKKVNLIRKKQIVKKSILFRYTTLNATRILFHHAALKKKTIKFNAKSIGKKQKTHNRTETIDKSICCEKLQTAACTFKVEESFKLTKAGIFKIEDKVMKEAQRNDCDL